MSIFLNLSEKEQSKPIYRIISIKRLFELFEMNKNILVHPSLWDDPYENLILKSKVRSNAGEIVNYRFHKNFYGQCWSLHRASDAMWRIYSPDKRGIRIKTTPNKLLSSLYQGGAEDPSRSCVIGKVRYLSEKRLLGFGNSIYKNGSLSKDNLFHSLLVKRLAFKHEREVRLMYYDLHDSERSKKFSYYFNPHEVIDQLMIDPRLTKEEAFNIKSELIKVTGYEGPIKRSLLYAVPEEIVLNDNKA